MYIPVYYRFDNFEASIVTFLRNIFRIIGITGYDVGYQAVNSVGDAIGSHDGIVAGYSSVGIGLVINIIAENLCSGGNSIKKFMRRRKFWVTCPIST